MDDLIKDVAEKAGISEDKAKIAVRTVLDYLEHQKDPEKARKTAIAALAATTAAINVAVLPHHV
jgi:hypothetical protein